MCLCMLWLGHGNLDAATLNLAWDASAGASGYRVWTSVGTAAFVASGTVNAPATTMTVTASDTQTTRYYVTAFNSAGESVPSNTVTNTPAVAPPVFGLSFEAEAGAITAPFYVAGGAVQQDTFTSVSAGGRASYVFMVTNAGSYNVAMLLNARDDGADSLFVNIDQEPADPANVWHIPLTTGFENRVVNWNGASNSTAFALSAGAHTLIVRGREPGLQFDRITVVPVVVIPPTPQPPQPPTNLRANAVSVSRIDVSWQLAAPEVVKLQRSRDNLLWTEIATVPSGNSYYTDGGLQRVKVYYYRARSFNPVGFSTFSNVAFDRTLKH